VFAGDGPLRAELDALARDIYPVQCILPVSFNAMNWPTIMRWQNAGDANPY